MIIVTGAAGFIGSYLVQALLNAGFDQIVGVDDFSRPDKKRNWNDKSFVATVDRMQLMRWLEKRHAEVTAVFHMGARTDTTEMNAAIFDQLNLEYSKSLWMLCQGYGIPLYYASSAATYGLGDLGFSDDHALIPQLRPLNPYGQSKQDFDVWVLNQIERHGAAAPWAGFKFFNVYGPNEYHKGRMASVIFHTARQIAQTGQMRLFRSHRPDFKDGEQSRDFIYVKDVAAVLLHFLENKPADGIYNLGTGKARTFYDLATGTFRALGVEPQINFIDTPADIRDTYQYFTEANMGKLRRAGYIEPFCELEEGIDDYVKNYLREERIF